MTYAEYRRCRYFKSQQRARTFCCRSVTRTRGILCKGRVLGLSPPKNVGDKERKKGQEFTATLRARSRDRKAGNCFKLHVVVSCWFFYYYFAPWLRIKKKKRKGKIDRIDVFTDRQTTGLSLQSLNSGNMYFWSKDRLTRPAVRIETPLSIPEAGFR